MSGPQIVKSLLMGEVHFSSSFHQQLSLANDTYRCKQGVTLNLLRDDSLPRDHLDHWQAEAICSGDGPPLSVPLHWHKKHSERMTVYEGRVEATVDGVKRIVSAGETIYIPAYAIHGFEGFKGERTVVRERADPAGDYKAAFFNDLLSQGWPAPFWHTMRAFYDGDGYPPMGLYFKFFDVAFITIVGGIAKFIAPVKPKLE
ncbi:hypothetical protein EK21DRAFT_107634 [Setomelanomma holmii]|uniref:Cupin type-2 domain-containing protein n=1 Tax=Setomelanomma holmii TaxID=210430 RepID=A0A9P4HKT0_9PLEO|nr:hypothetical protein EK21DRAFT_107634 [Setomelanomma holmii]